jgi:myo-inositol-1(or 4)-monophosphatase
MLGELFLGERGKGATLNGQRIRVSKQTKLISSLLVTGFPYDRQKHGQYYLKFVGAMLKHCMGLRRLGSAALDLAWVACGRVEGYWEFNLNPWDVAGGWLVVEEAGGKVTDFSNWPLRINDPSQILATNALIHDEMLAQFKKVLR